MEYFSNSLIIHEEKTKVIATVKEVWTCDRNYQKIWWTFALNFLKNYRWFEKLYQTLERVFHLIVNHLKVCLKSTAATRFLNPLLFFKIPFPNLLQGSDFRFMNYELLFM